MGLLLPLTFVLLLLPVLLQQWAADAISITSRSCCCCSSLTP
jgi:hypothetical protein